VQVASVAEAATAYGAEAAARGATFLLVRDLATARKLVETGAAVREWNVGGLHYSPGKEKVNDYVYLDARDRADALALLLLGVGLVVQDVPASRPEALVALDPALTA